MTSFFDKLPDLTIKKQLPQPAAAFDPYSFLSIREEPSNADERFKEAQRLFSSESNTALKYLESAAREDHAASLDLLGMLYATGEILERDPKRAVSLFRRAATQGETTAKFHLAMALREGFGVPKNLNDSFAWLRVAAKEKSAEAMFALAEAFEKGWGTEQNLLIAEDYFCKAANRGEKKAIERMIALSSSADHPNAKLCMHWLRKGAEAKIPSCLLAVGRYWLENNPKNPDHGLSFLIDGAYAQDRDCLYELAILFSDGRFIPKDPVAATVFCHLSSTFGNWLAAQYLSELRKIASSEELQEAAFLASLPSSEAVIRETIKRRKSDA